MAVRLLIMFSVMILELGLGIAAILNQVPEHSYGMPEHSYGIRQTTVAGIVMTVVAILVAWLVTIALFVRKSSRAKARRLVEEARLEAGRILGDATEKALALCGMDGGRCKKCGNARTGKFCPQCGNTGATA